MKTYEPLRSGKRPTEEAQVLTAALGLFRIAGHILQAFRLICREGSRAIMALRVQGVLKRVPIIAPPP